MSNNQFNLELQKILDAHIKPAEPADDPDSTDLMDAITRQGKQIEDITRRVDLIEKQMVNHTSDN